jgi:hypothetical protein
MGKAFFRFIVAMLAFGAARIEAEVIDPQGSFENFVEGASIQDVDAFDFAANATGGGVFNFRNVSDANWNHFDFFVTIPQGEEITCLPGPFFIRCNLISGTPVGGLAPFDLHFEDPTTPGGILTGMIFAFNLNDPLPGGAHNLDPNGTGGWGAGNKFHVFTPSDPPPPPPGVTLSPEPAASALMASGIALMGIFYRLSRGRATRLQRLNFAIKPPKSGSE